MAFEKIDRRPPRAEMLTTRELARMGKQQYREQVNYWKALGEAGGFLQVEMAEDIMLNGALNWLQACRRNPKADIIVYDGVHKTYERLARQALAVLALGELLRTDACETYLRRGSVSASEQTIGIDVSVAGGLPPVGYMHETLDLAGHILPSLDLESGSSFYRNGPLIVTVSSPAMPTSDFMERFAAVAGPGAPGFDPSRYATLRPQLHHTYIPDVRGASGQ